MRWLRFMLLSAAALVAAAASTVLAIAVNVATGGTAHRLPFIEHHPWRWSAGATVAVAGAGLLFWWTQRFYERKPTPQTSSEAKPAYGRRLVERWDPVELGVHRVIGGRPMPAYIRRPHDEVLRVVLDPAVTASRLVVVRGGSSTGKTRAAWEAVAAVLAGWQLDYPLDAGALAARLEAGVPARTVLWLGELRQYADADGGPAALGRLADLLQGKGHLIITTMWPEHWDAYIAAARAGPGAADPAGTVGRLLERLPELSGEDWTRIYSPRGGVIDVPDRFTDDDLEAAAHAGDPALISAAAAAASAGQAGQVTQYLAGVPDLLRRYAGPGGDPYGQAIITAAMDAARLGHAGPLPAALLQEGAVGYLTGPQRTTSIENWRDTALAWATAELNGAVQALQPVPLAAGTGVAGYQVADYLDQHGRRARQDQLAPHSLWEAVAAHTTSASDLIRLAQAARDRGLFRHAAALWTTAVTVGSAEAARQLVIHLREFSPRDTTRAARWAASYVSIGNPWDVAMRLGTLHQAEADNAVHVLLARDPASHAGLDEPKSVILLLRGLHEAGAEDAARTLATRAADQISLDDPGAVASLLSELRSARISGAARTLLARDPASHASLRDPVDSAGLLMELRGAGAEDAVRTLATRAADQISLDDPGAVAWLLEVLREVGANDAARALLARDPASHANLDEPEDIAFLLRNLDEAGANAAAHTLIIRAVGHYDPADIAWLLEALRQSGAIDPARALADLAADLANLDNPGAVAGLLRELHRFRADDPIRALLARDPASHANLGDPRGVAQLLRELRAVSADDAVRALLARDPASHADLDDPWGAAALLEALREVGASPAACALADRAAGHASLDDPGAVASLLRELRAVSADDAVHTLLARDPSGHASFGDPRGVAQLLRELRAVSADDAVRALLARDPASHADLDDPWAVDELLDALGEAGANPSARILADRAANAGMFDSYLKACPDRAPSYRFGREPNGAPSQPWSWHEPAMSRR